MLTLLFSQIFARSTSSHRRSYISLVSQDQRLLLRTDLRLSCGGLSVVVIQNVQVF